MACGQVHADGCPERHARNMCLLYSDGAEEGGDLVGWPWVEYGPGGLSLSPVPGRSMAMQLKCSE